MSAFVAITLSCAKSTISLMMMGPSYYRLLASVLHGNIMISFGTSSQSEVDQPSVLKMTRRGLFMNKYIFPGADVHYSATIWRWYKNWLSNEDKVTEKYGRRWVEQHRGTIASCHDSSTLTMQVVPPLGVLPCMVCYRRSVCCPPLFLFVPS